MPPKKQNGITPKELKNLELAFHARIKDMLSTTPSKFHEELLFRFKVVLDKYLSEEYQNKEREPQ